MRWITRAGIVVSICVVVTGPAGATPFGNIDNTPFATRANGPVGAILVPQPPAGVGIAQTAVSQATAVQHSPLSLQRAAHTIQLLQQLGLKSSAARPRFPRTAYHVSGSQVQLPDLVRTMQTPAQIGDPSNEIQFEFQGFDAAQETAFRNYLDNAMPVARQIYGPPAFDITVTVILDESLAEIQGGVYDATANEIRLAPLSGNFGEDTFILMMLVLNAFHDDLAFFYDTWEQGFASHTRRGPRL